MPIVVAASTCPIANAIRASAWLFLRIKAPSGAGILPKPRNPVNQISTSETQARRQIRTTNKQMVQEVASGPTSAVNGS
ncbi:hypothetical protein [Alloyangia pacifica]|uniref:hypothetical protein n=1 Tax=Alloyangia pacifica TaxID=311180 RepID=UPI00115FC37A|nr:hypothetical protein [Alloyangia pacifica]